eukprot:g26847.t1
MARSERSRRDRSRSRDRGKRQEERAKQRCSSSSPEKEKGYVVEKLAEGKPAAEAGVDSGWRVVRVAGQDSHLGALIACSSGPKGWLFSAFFDRFEHDPRFDPRKEAALPVEVQFQKPEEEALPSSEEDENNIQNVRADHRRQHEASLSNIDDLPVERDPSDLPEPIASWRDACERRLHAAGLKRPTLIQRHAVPIVGHKEHYDLVAQAQTGSGKTFAFVIPTTPGPVPIARLLLRGCPPRPFFPGPTAQGCPVVLVLSPTRELAIQTCSEMEVLTKGSKLTQMSIYGGETIKETAKRVETAPIDIICATPGRLIALLDETKISLAYVQTVILDEADQMLEQRLETRPRKIRDMCPQILREKRRANLTIGFYDDDKGGSCESITQRLDSLAHQLQREGMTCRHLHGKLDQEVREKVFDGFRRGDFDILVATNVASRGLDFPDVSLVVQFNLPDNIDVYTHRVGRTGRIGQVGHALAYLGPKDKKIAAKLVEFLELNKQEVPERTPVAPTLAVSPNAWRGMTAKGGAQVHNNGVARPMALITDGNRKLEEYKARESIYISALVNQEAEMTRLRSLAAEIMGAYGNVSKAALRGALADATSNMEVLVLRQQARAKEQRVRQLKDDLEANRFDQSDPAGKALMQKCKATTVNQRRSLLRTESLASSCNRSVSQSCALPFKTSRGRMPSSSRNARRDNEKLQNNIAKVSGSLRQARAELETLKRQRQEVKAQRKQAKLLKQQAAALTNELSGAEIPADAAVEVVDDDEADAAPKEKKAKKRKKARRGLS